MRALQLQANVSYTLQEKLNVLLDQKNDMFVSISQLIEDIEAGDKYMKVYKQMKMYNDEELNPVLYQNKK